MTVTYESMNEADTFIAKIDGGDRFEFITDADGPLQAEYQAWLANGNTLLPYAAPLTPVPQIISDRQFFQQAAVAGLITQAEALAAVQTGSIPAMLQMVVDELPDANQRFAATMLLAGATQFERNHPLTVEVGTHLGLTTAQVDDFFIAAAQL